MNATEGKAAEVAAQLARIKEQRSERGDAGSVWTDVYVTAVETLLAEVQSRDATIAALRGDAERRRAGTLALCDAGAPLANCAHNLAQRDSRVTERDRVVLADCCRKWDSAMMAAVNPPGAGR